MKRIATFFVNIASALIGFAVAVLCSEALFVAIGRWIDGDDFGSPGYTDYGLGMLALFVGVPLLIALTLVFTRICRKFIGNRVSKVLN